MANQLIFLTVAFVVLARPSLAMPTQSVDQEALAATQVDNSEEAAKSVGTGNSENTAAQAWKENIIKITVQDGSVVIELKNLESTAIDTDNRYSYENAAASNANGSGANVAYANQSLNWNDAQNSTANE